MRPFQSRLCLITSALMASGCATRVTPPNTRPPVPGYISVDASTAEAWDAVVDFLVDNGVDFDYISADMRVAKVDVLLAVGPLPAGRGTFTANTIARTLADCGTENGEPIAGWGNLVADVAVRVRPAATGSLLKVVIPRVRQVHATGREVACVSRGIFEQRAEEAIGERLRPIMKSTVGREMVLRMFPHPRDMRSSHAARG